MNPKIGSRRVRVKLPQGNSLVLSVLRSPFHRLLSGLVVELRYRGRRSGRMYALPLQYARHGDVLVIVPQNADTKTWWRNFRTRQPVTVLLTGRVYMATAEVVAPDEPRWESDREVYLARWRRLAGPVVGPVVEVSDLTEDHTYDPATSI